MRQKINLIAVTYSELWAIKHHLACVMTNATKFKTYCNAFVHQAQQIL